MKTLKYFIPAFLLAALTIAGCKSDTTGPNNTGNGPTINSFTATPSTVDFTLGQDHSVLKWSTDGSATSLSIDQGVGDQTNNGDDSVVVYPSQNTTYTLTAKNSNGTSTKTVTVSVNNPSESGAPPIPQQLNANAGATSPSTINLSWSASSGAAKYIIERRLVGTTATSFFVISTSTTGTSYADAGLYPGFKYAYRIRAVSGSGAKSGYSNTASAIAPGQPPTISKIVLSPAAAPTLTPGQTQLFTALAFDASFNQLNFQPGAFQWMSDNTTIVSINDTGLATANQTSGSANITASLPNPDGSTVTSDPVNVAVAAPPAHSTLVLYYGSSDMSQFAEYLAPLAASGVGFDKLTDFTDGGAPQFSVQQLSGYSKVIVIQNNARFSDGAISVFQQYLDLGGKKLAFVTTDYGDMDGIINTASYGNFSTSYTYVSDLKPQVQGQSGTIFSGFSFNLSGSSGINTATPNSGGPAVPALIATNQSDNSQVILAVQAALSDGSTLMYSGVPIDDISGTSQQAYINAIMNF